MTELMELQTKSLPLPLARAEIRSLSAEVRSCLDELSATNIPNTLGHLDFNPGNILVSPEQCVFLDWAEGSVGHPFFTFQYLLEYWRRFHGVELDSEQMLVSSYALPWRAFASADEIAKNLTLAPLLAVFAYVAGSRAWRHSELLRDGRAAGYLRSLVRRMKREADLLRERRVVCLP
jgi:aminoglycoside phosphotransferase (APT) family kinase protein